MRGEKEALSFAMYAIPHMVLMALVFMPAVLRAQEPAAPPPEAAVPETQPAEAREPLQARVIRVSGRVSYAVADEEGMVGEWRPVTVGDVYSAGTRIRTQLRSQVGLAFGDDSVILIERATLASIDQFYRTADTQRVQLGLGHGAVRGGVAETVLRSDLSIETPTATLSKRGTIDFRIEYEPSSGRFRISLAREGLVEALSKVTGESRLVRPGQYVTQAMLDWIDMLTLDRWISVIDWFGTTDAEKYFHAWKGSGLAVVEPGGGTQIWSFAGRDAGGFHADMIARQRTGFFLTPGLLGLALLPGLTPAPGVIDRPEGAFGVGPGAIPVLLKAAR